MQGRERKEGKVTNVSMYSKSRGKKAAERVEEGAEAAERVVVVYIKATDHYQHIRYSKDKVLQEKGDRLTELWCGEIINGKITSREFHAFVRLEDRDLVERCRERYMNEKELSDVERGELIDHLHTGRLFSEVEKEFRDFTFTPGTKVISHFKFRPLEHLRAQASPEFKAYLDANHKDVWRDFESDIALLRKAGLYDETLYQSKLDDKGHASPVDGKARRTMEVEAKELGVKSSRKTKFSAEYDGRRLVTAYLNAQKRLNSIAEPDEPRNVRMKK